MELLENKMTDRYAKYRQLAIDYPRDRVLRITLNKPETRNSLAKVKQLARDGVLRIRGHVSLMEFVEIVFHR